MKSWLLTLGFGVALTVAGRASAAPGDDIYMHPGLIAEAKDGARLNFTCVGTGSPAVIFDAGYTDWSPAWATVQPAVGAFTRACSYDRAGSGFSGPAPLPRTVERMAAELHDALRAGGIRGPFILVGEAFGGDPVRAFADLYPTDVAGLVLIEADASDVDTPDNRRRDDRGGMNYLPLLKKCRDAIASGNTEFALPPPPGRPPRKCITGFFRGLPEKMWSADLNAKLLDIARHNVAMWDAVLSELQETPADETWLQAHRRSLGSTPVRILTTGNHAVHFLDKPPPPTIDHLKMEYDSAVAQSHWLSLSSDSKQIFVQRSGEYVQFDRPDAVIDAIREVWAKTSR